MFESKPLFSVLIGTKDRPDAVISCVKSVLAQTYEDLEVLILDDNSKESAVFLRPRWFKMIMIDFGFASFQVMIIKTKDGQRAISNLAQRVGTADIRIEIVREIERTTAGKFRAVICNLSTKTTS